MITIREFRGEVPSRHPKLLLDNHAQIADTCRFESGALVPHRYRDVIFSDSTPAQTFVKHLGAWLKWNAVVAAIPGPVATDRLYIFGDGVPKLRVGSTTYPLALTRPTGRPTGTLRRALERICTDVEGRLIGLTDGFTRTVGGWTYDVSVKGDKATVTCTHPGLSPALTAVWINNLQYRTTGVIPALKVIKIVSITDSGGQTLDTNKVKVGSPRRTLDAVGTLVRVGGDTTPYDWPIADTQNDDDIPDQNDPPVLTVTGLAPAVTANNTYYPLFTGAAINTIEAGQNIIQVKITVEGLTNGVVDERQAVDFVYAYTYVSVFDEETEPSLLSNVVKWGPSQAVRLTGFAAPPAGHRFDRMRIYRSETSATGQTDLYLIAERPVSTDPFDDATTLLPIQEPLPTLLFNTPPASLTGAVSMPNGMMAAFTGRSLYFAEPYRPHAWPATYMQRVDSDIVGLAAFGTSLAVLTKAQPYVCQGTHPSQMSLAKIEADFPCIAARSIVDMGYYAAYASPRGLATISGNDVKLVTGEILSRRDWEELRPETFIASSHGGRYVALHQDFHNPSETWTSVFNADSPEITRTRNTAKHYWREAEADRLYYLHRTANSIFEFDPVEGAFRTFIWRSKQFIFNQATSFSCVLIDAEGRENIMAKIFGDGQLIAVVTDANEVVRIPGGKLCRQWEVEITGSMRVLAFYMAHAPEEIAQAMAATA